MSKKVLIVDDNQQISSLLKEILELKNYEPSVSTNASEALDLYRNNEFDIVITDLKLEDSIDGVELIKQMKLIRDTKFIVSSGYSDGVDQETMKTVGIKGFLGKPYVFNDLFSLLES